MENISYVGISQQTSLTQQMEVTANNLANMSTPGYKAQSTLFTDYVTADNAKEKLHQTQNFATYRDLSLGNLQQTHNKLDMAISGDGYFAVSTANGVRYTRDGGFALNLNHELVSKTGNLLLSQNGNPIAIPPDATQITIADDGTIASEFGDLGRVKVATFANPQALVKEGDNLYNAGTQAELPADNMHIEQGVLEGSNVSPVVEMNRMVELMRMFQAAQNMLLTDHDRIRGAIQKLTSING